MAEFPLSTSIENGKFSKWRNFRFQPALKTGVFKMAEFPFSIGIENGNFR
jgi:hypothetical protein